MDFNDEIGHVVINPKHFSDFIVVDHDKTFVSTTNFAANIAAAAGPDGDIIYRWGNPSSYNAGTAPGWMNEGDSQMYGSHNIQFIRPYHWQRPHLATDKWPDPATYIKSGVTLPGAGNFLIFDNGCYNPSPNIGSRVLEINPRIGASGVEEVPKGQYIWPVVAGYQAATGNYPAPAQQAARLELPVQRAAELLQQPYLGLPASAERQYLDHVREPGPLLRGDTVGEVVWEYLYPAATVSGGPLRSKPLRATATTPGRWTTPITKDGLSIFRHHRLGADHPAFTGKDLTPGATLTGRNPRLVGKVRHLPDARDLHRVRIRGHGYSWSAAAAEPGRRRQRRRRRLLSSPA